MDQLAVVLVTTAVHTTALLFTRTRSLPALAGFLVLTLIAALWGGPDLRSVPMADSRSGSDLALWSSVLGTLIAPLVASSVSSWEVRVPSRPLARWRLAWAVSLITVPVLLHAGVAALRFGPDWWYWSWWFARNLAALGGLSMVCSRILPAATAWVPAGAYALICWFVGTSDDMGTAHWWALPHQLPDSTGAAFVAVVLVALGLVSQLHPPAREL